MPSLKRTFCSVLLLSACSAAQATAPTPPASPSASPSAQTAVPADREAFLGRWSGPYACGIGTAIDDQLEIAAGEQALAVKLILFQKISRSPVTGTLTSPDQITIPPQRINGATTSGSLMLAKGKLTLRLHGLGTDCLGQDYAPVPNPASSP